MPVQIEITVNMQPFEQALERLARSSLDMAPVMRDIAGLLERETDDNFRAQGRPPWKPLAQATILGRLMGRDKDGKSKGLGSILNRQGDLRASARRKLEGGMAILQDTGTLRGSIRAFTDDDHVVIGSGLQYAAIHQFGGKAGRGRKVTIPARPFLPVDREGNLSPEAEKGVLAAILDHLARSV